MGSVVPLVVSVMFTEYTSMFGFICICTWSSSVPSRIGRSRIGGFHSIIIVDPLSLVAVRLVGAGKLSVGRDNYLGDTSNN